jgi:hypothetical protein
LWKALLLEADQADKLMLLERADQFFAAGGRILENVLRSEIEARSGRRRDVSALSTDERRQRVAAALLRGEQPADSLCGGDIHVAENYLVLAVRSNQLLDSLRPLLQDDWFTARQRATTVLLVPVDQSDPQQPADAGARQAFEALHPAGPAGLAIPAGIEEIPTAVGDAQEVVTTLSHLTHVAPGLYRLDDVLLEAVLCRSRELASRLAGKLAPVVAQTPHLLDTLEAFLDSDCERRELARQLYIHPNTLSYRLKRVWELTGLSLTSVHDLCLLKASLTALRLVGVDEADAAPPDSDHRPTLHPVRTA